jgi:hypothetical protein
MRQPSPEMLLSLPILQRSIISTTHPPGRATIDRAVVTADEKRANSNDVLKSQPVVIADLQHPTIEPILKVEVVAEGIPAPCQNRREIPWLAKEAACR